jgi:hypothetical protein
MILLVAVFMACSGETKNSKGSTSTSTDALPEVAAKAQPLDGCTVVMKADVEAAFAPRHFEDGEKGRGNSAGTDRLAAVSACTFTSRGATASERMTIGIVLRRAPSDDAGITVAGAKEGAVKLNTTPVDVLGLGHSAYWVNLGSSKHPVIELNVFKGRRLWLIYSAAGSQLESEDVVAELTTLAETTLERF